MSETATSNDGKSNFEALGAFLSECLAQIQHQLSSELVPSIVVQIKGAPVGACCIVTELSNIDSLVKDLMALQQSDTLKSVDIEV